MGDDRRFPDDLRSGYVTTLGAPSTPAVHITEEPAKWRLLHSCWNSWVRECLDFGTTDHFGVPDAHRFDGPAGVTDWVVYSRSGSPSVAVEVKRLRDHVVHRIGLSRQEIARAIGVDRRSLSGYVAGEIRPTESRMEALRTLAETATWSEAEFGERAREVFQSSDDGSALLDRIAEGHTDIRWEVRETAARIGLAAGPVVTTRTRETRRPLYLNAVATWRSESRLPERRGTPRDASVYEQDLSQAPAGVAPPERPRRRSI
ncbi:helix-turn-helix domain-containing protein [Candidatus Poriferisodalis sp.]|uniref:helix-turn-helix domain-containing protein n=1 Tax=Candidatus Poriferisodalis sp. TaxID=3101277 RepID=UPI003AF43CED